jgi:hypothetical protein
MANLPLRPYGIVYDNDPELAYAKGGVLEAFDRPGGEQTAS